MNRKGIFGNMAILFMASIVGTVFLAGMAGAAIPHEEWNWTFGGPNDDAIFSGQQTSDGGYILAGGTNGSLLPCQPCGYDAWLVKTNRTGYRLWSKMIAGTDYNQDSQALSVQQTSDEGYIVAGNVISFPGSISHVWLIKTDANGNKLWNASLNRTGSDAIRFVNQASDGGYILAGDAAGYIWIIKADSNGKEQWNTTYGGVNTGNIFSVMQTLDGGYIAAGNTYDSGNSDALVIKIDSSGNEIWSRTFGGAADSDFASSIQQIPDGSYIIGGWTRSYGAGSSDAWLIKINKDGDKLWDKTFGGPNAEMASSVEQTSDGGYMLAGTTWSSGASHQSAWIIKTDSSGNKLWDKTFEGTGNYRANFAQQTSDEGYILGGGARPSGTGYYDAWLAKLSNETDVPTPTPTITSTPTATATPPLTVSITSPADNSYSEESVSFKGIASGGVPPYTYTWTSNRIAGPLGNTEEFSTKLAFNNETQEMNKHTITLSVKDSTGNSAPAQTVELNVVVQKIKAVVVPVVAAGHEFTVDDRNRIIKLAEDSREYYRKSSYGAIRLDIDYKFDSVLITNVDHSLPIDGVLMDVEQDIADRLEHLPPSFEELPEYDTLLLADIQLNEKGLARTSQQVRVETPSLFPKTVMTLPAGASTRLGTWVHEFGHTFGNSVLTSEAHSDPVNLDGSLLYGGNWANGCNELYYCSNLLGWDVMAAGTLVYGGKETWSGDVSDNPDNNQPTDMSVISKVKLGWLNKTYVTGSNAEYYVRATENLHYRDNITVYKTGLNSHEEYYIEARQPINPSYYQHPMKLSLDCLECIWDYHWDALDNGVIVYRATTIYAGKPNMKYMVNMYSSDFDSKPTFLAAEGSSVRFMIDAYRFIKFSVIESNSVPSYNAKIRIEPCDNDCQKLSGMKMDDEIYFGASSSFSASFNNSTVPHLTLHAVTPSGLHIGPNHTSGGYDMQIPGGVSSGDTIGEQWIFVPTGTPVSYFVDSYDVEQYLLENPGLDPANFSVNYSTTLMEYGENPRRVELPDGNWTVTNRTVSTPKEDTIKPGVTKIIDNTPPAITITTPANTSYILKQPVIANWRATDNESGINTTTATAANGTQINTATVGSKSFTVNATDNAGNQASKAVSYNVVYNYTPLKLGISNTFVKGTPIAVRFQLKDANKKDISNAKARIYLAKVTKGVVGKEIAGTSVTKLIKDNQFKYLQLGKQYVFDLDTAKLSTGTWRIRIELDDGTSKYVQIGLK